MSRYDHALNKHPKTGIIKKLGNLLNGDGVRVRTGEASADPLNNAGGTPGTPGPIQVQGGIGGVGFDYGSTGVGFGYGSTGLQGVTSAASGPPYPLSNPADPSAFIRPFTEQFAPRDASRDIPQSSSLNSMTPIVPSDDGSALIGRAPGSLHFTLTGPGGYRAFIPLRNLDMSVQNDSDIIIRLPSSVARDLIRDIEQNGGRGRIRRNGSL